MNAAEIELATRVASLHYFEDATQAEIASLLGLSRSKIGRLLRKARDEGIVEITIRPHPELNAKLELAFAHHFGLSQAILVLDQRNVESQRRLVARAAADVLTRTLRNEFVVAVGMGRNVGAIPEELVNPPKRSSLFISAIGGSADVGPGINSNDICRRLAERYHGSAESLYAPPYAQNAREYRMLLKHTDVQRTMSRARKADIVIVGVGGASDDSGMVRMGCFSAAEMARMRDAGAVGDLVGVVFDADGDPVEAGVAGIEHRVVALSGDDLRAIPRVIVMASEPQKGAAIVGALNTETPDVLITTVGLAKEALARSDGNRSTRGARVRAYDANPTGEAIR